MVIIALATLSALSHDHKESAVRVVNLRVVLKGNIRHVDGDGFNQMKFVSYIVEW